MGLLKLTRITPYLILAILGYLLYVPGLSAYFQLDDWPNLNGLISVQRTGAPVDFWLYVLSKVGVGGSGRPLALFSFALQSEHWPHSPQSFLRVNLTLHLINACLVYLFLNRLTLYIQIFPRYRIQFVFSVALLWLILPMHVSSVLYVVQRMTIMSGTFVLLGLIGFLSGRLLLEAGQQLRGLAIMSLSVTFAGLMAVLSKESGYLLVAYILALELTLLRSRPIVSAGWQAWKLFFIWLPMLLLPLYFLSNAQGHFIGAYAHRDFNVVERLLTQARVIVDYISLIVAPNPLKLGLYNDGYGVSKGLFEPVSTFYCVLLLSFITLSALWFRKSRPVWGFCVCWFLSGHLIESTFISLELYFEHRNYLPSLGILFALVYAAFWCADRLVFVGRKVVFSVALTCYISLIFVVCYQQTSLWGRPLQYAVAQYRYHPESVRAKAFLSQAYENNERYADAAVLIEEVRTTWPEMSGPYLQLWALHCLDASITVSSKEFVRQHLLRSKFDYAAVPSIRDIILAKQMGGCNELSYDDIRGFLSSLKQNAVFANLSISIQQQVINTYLQQNDYDAALKVIEALPNSVDLKLQAARIAATAGFFDLALIYIADAQNLRYQSVRSWLLQTEVELLKAIVLEDKLLNEA